MIVRIIPILRLPPSVASYYDYTVGDKSPKIGSVVQVPFHGRSVQGVVIKTLKRKPAGIKKLKEVSKVVHPESIVTNEQIKLALYLARSAKVSTALAIKTIVPQIPKRKVKKTLKHKNKKTNVIPVETGIQKSIKLEMTPKPNTVLNSKSTYLLQHNSQLELNAFIQKVLKSLPKKKQLLVLVPEINDVEKFPYSTFHIPYSKVHSKLSKTKFFTEWTNILSGNARVIIGTKRALFMPFKDLGAIVISQEESPNHDNYEQKPHYSGRDIADLLRIEHGCPLILTSPAPSLETWRAVENKDTKKIEIRNSKFKIPAIRLVDLIDEARKEHYSVLSEELRDKINKIITNHSPLATNHSNIFIFHNRKGFATIVKCKDCNHAFNCPSCEKSLIQHVRAENFLPLRCNSCDYIEDLPPLCPSCNGPNLKPLGKGTQRIASILKKEFPKVEILRLDKDSPSLTTNHSPLATRIIVGTEYALSRIDWSRIGLVGIINIDPMLVLPDANAQLRTYQILKRIQSSLLVLPPSRWEQEGGYKSKSLNPKRSTLNASIIIQTHSPRLPIFQSLAKNNPEIFYKNELKTRTI